MPDRLDPAGVLGGLTDAAVDFVLIGGLAVGVHGYVRATKDVDIMVPVGSESNARRLRDALVELDAERVTPDHTEVVADPEYPTLIFRTRHGRLDLLYRPDGSPRYDLVRRRAVVRRIGGREVAVVSLDDLIAMKLAAGRAGDINDVVVLTAAERAMTPTLTLRASYRLAEGADPHGAAEFLRSRVTEMDLAAIVTAGDGALNIEVRRNDLTATHLRDWAVALGERLRGFEVGSGEPPQMSIDGPD